MGCNTTGPERTCLLSAPSSAPLKGSLPSTTGGMFGAFWPGGLSFPPFAPYLGAVLDRSAARSRFRSFERRNGPVRRGDCGQFWGWVEEAVRNGGQEPAHPERDGEEPLATLKDVVPAGVDPRTCLPTLLPDTTWSLPNIQATCIARVFNGTYISYVLRVRYRMEGFGPRPFVTWARINMPCVDYGIYDSDDNPLGVAVIVEGNLSGEVGVCQREEDETFGLLTSRLASGMRAADDPEAASDTFLNYRDGNPMVTVYFTQPGRADPSGLFPAEGHPDYVGDTFGNPAGRDYWGSGTRDCMEAVMTLAMRMVEDQEELSGETFEARILVLSSSAGLVAATRWIEETAFRTRVHALIDCEGPADAMDLSNGAEAISTPPDTDGVDDGDLESVAMPDDISWADWEVWAGDPTEAFLLFFRPPDVVLDELPARPFILESCLDFPALIPFWVDWYGPAAYDPTELATTVGAFWAERTPATRLPSIVTGDFFYVRIQGEIAHSGPDWSRGWNAVKALHAAWNGGAGAGRVKVVDWTCIIEPDLMLTDPVTMDSDFDPGTYDGESWPDWSESIAFFENIWTVQVHVARWALSNHVI